MAPTTIYILMTFKEVFLFQIWLLIFPHNNPSALKIDITKTEFTIPPLKSVLYLVWSEENARSTWSLCWVRFYRSRLWDEREMQAQSKDMLPGESSKRTRERGMGQSGSQSAKVLASAWSRRGALQWISHPSDCAISRQGSRAFIFLCSQALAKSHLGTGMGNINCQALAALCNMCSKAPRSYGAVLHGSNEHRVLGRGQSAEGVGAQRALSTPLRPPAPSALATLESSLSCILCIVPAAESYGQLLSNWSWLLPCCTGSPRHFQHELLEQPLTWWLCLSSKPPLN